MQKSELDAHFRTILVLWGALLGGVTLFAAVVWALTSEYVGHWSPTMEPGVVRNLLAAPVLLMAAGIFFRRGGIDRSGGPEAVIQRYQTRVLIASAMQEGGGLLGLVLCLLADMPIWALAVWGLTAAAMGMSRPKRTDLTPLDG